MRIGQGFDVHPLTEGRKLIIGGVEIAYHKGLDGHSDADVPLPAICDALLGAAGLGDIGRHYPDTDASYAGVDSRALLRDVAQKLKTKKLKVVNIDATILAQAPRTQRGFDRRAMLALAACAVFGVVLGYGGGQLAPPPLEDDVYFIMAFEAPFAFEDEG